ncbi:MAG: T9SS type A sorting domain-containing protein [Bacteroidota bacterium]
MQKKLPFIYWLFGISLAALFISFSSNPPNGRTGAPGDGTCASCHGGNNPNGFDGGVTITGLPATVSPNTTYPLTITVDNPNGAAARAGFQWVALRDSDNTNIGTISNADGNSTVTFSNNRNYHEHAPALSYGSSTSLSWTADWTSPAAGSSDEGITFYAISVIGNGSGSSGDLVALSQTTTTLQGSTVPLTLSINNVSGVSCFGDNDGSATAVPSGGAPPYTFQWSNGETSATANNLPAGQAFVTVSDDNGQSIIDDVIIATPSALTFNIVSTTGIDCTTTAGTATVTASGGTPSYTFSWANGATGTTVNNLAAGDTQVTVTDLNGCESVLTVTIDSDTAAPNAEAGTAQTIDCNNTTASLTGTAPGCTNCTFAWSTMDGNITAGQNLAIATVNQAGLYTLTVTNLDNGCTNTDQVQVAENTTPPNADAGAAATITCTTASVQLTGTAPSCTNCTFAWSTMDGNITVGQNLATATVNQAGLYTLTVTNLDNGCTNTDQVQVAENTTPPNADAGATATITCTTTSVQLTGTAPGCTNCTFAWATMDGNITAGQNLATATVNEAGSYTLTVTNLDNGCTNTDQVQVAEDTTPPTALIAPPLSLDCNNPEVTLSGDASVCPSCIYEWTTDGGSFTASTNTPSTMVDAGGTYTLTVTNTINGCSAAATVQIDADFETPVADAGSDALITCANPTATLTASAGDCMGCTFAWMTDIGNIVNNNNTNQSIIVDAAGNYTLTVTNPENGCTQTDIAQVTIDTLLPNVDAGPTATLTCNTTSQTLSANFSNCPDCVFSWSNEAGTIVGTTQSIEVAEAGTYTVTATIPATGCARSDQVIVDEDIPVSLELEQTTNVSCNGGSDGAAIVNTADGLEPFTFNWSNGVGTADLSQVPAGSYTLTVTDANGCIATLTTTISEPTAIQPNASATNESTLGANDGTASVQPDGGTPPYEVQWSNGATDLELSGLAPANYSVTVIDANGCTATASVTVSSVDCFLSTTVSATDVSCNGGSDGSATVSLENATAPVQVLWSSGGTDFTESNLAAGTYEVSITDANGCPAIEVITISEPDAINIELVSVDESAFGSSDGQIDASANGGTGNLSYQWSNGAMTPTIENLPPGTYAVTVTDENGCSQIATVTVEAFVCGVTNIEATIISNSCVGEAEGTISLEISGQANDPLSISWSNGATTPAIDNLAAGDYSVTVTDGTNCSTTQTYTIEEEDTEAPEVIVVSDLIIYLDEAGQANLPDIDQIVDVTDNCSVATTDVSQSAFSCDQIGANTIEVTATDGSNNMTTEQLSLTVLDTIAPSITCPEDIISVDCSGGITYDLPVTGDNCSVAQLILQDGIGSGGPFPEGVSTELYQVSDQSGNTADCVFTVTITNTLDAGVMTMPVSCAGDADGQIVINPTGGTPPYEISGPTDNLTSGMYNLTITDANGCTFDVEATILEPTPIEIQIDGVTDQTEGLADGAIDLSINGGTGGYTFEWTKDGEPFDAAVEDLTALLAGTYVLRVIDQNGCEAVETIVVDVIVSSVVLEQIIGFSAFPNPARDWVNVQLQLATPQAIQLSLIDLSGRLIQTMELPIQAEHEVRLELLNLPKGLYLIQADLAASKQVYLKKVMVE